MANYVTPDEIRSLLNVDSSKYSDTFLNILIQEKMSEVERLTNQKWNGETGTDEDYYSLTSFRGGYISYVGFPVFLKHTHIKSIDSLKIWNGSSYEEWIGVKTEGRDGDYWVDYIKGVLYINHRFLFPAGSKEIYVKYTYGRTDLPGQVKELTKLLVIRELLLWEKEQAAIPEGAGGLRISEQIERIDKRIQKLESYLRAIHITRYGE
ncbi:hypothetical protein JDFR1000234_78 [uncultured archaeal virus]|uniref:Uncharacterized protein n=1 Tax=uncultured archaeal virus TaxID=1960247 RepID=A0A1S5Y392_9VIRU|nr:hypothetical protein JDFR1000234_78 [uncultured archaeal virus]